MDKSTIKDSGSVTVVFVGFIASLFAWEGNSEPDRPRNSTTTRFRLLLPCITTLWLQVSMINEFELVIFSFLSGKQIKARVFPMETADLRIKFNTFW